MRSEPTPHFNQPCMNPGLLFSRIDLFSYSSPPRCFDLLLYSSRRALKIAPSQTRHFFFNFQTKGIDHETNSNVRKVLVSPSSLTLSDTFLESQSWSSVPVHIVSKTANLRKCAQIWNEEFQPNELQHVFGDISASGVSVFTIFLY